MGKESNTQAVVTKAIALRSLGLSWKEVEAEIKKGGFITATGKPFSQNYLYSLVSRRRKKAKKVQSRPKSELKQNDLKLDRSLQNYNNHKFKEFVEATVGLNLPPTRVVTIIKSALDMR